MKNAFEEYAAWFDTQSFSTKLDQVRRIQRTSLFIESERGVSALHYDGYLAKFARIGIHRDSGDYCVYIWKHAWVEPFYVGSGKGDRWKSKAPRCDEFYAHINEADAVVYKVIDGVDSKTARLYEQYISANLSDAGYSLANGDNNVNGLSEKAKLRLLEKCNKIADGDFTRDVEKVVFKILNDEPNCSYRTTVDFIKKNGTDYFSRNFSSASAQNSCPA